MRAYLSPFRRAPGIKIAEKVISEAENFGSGIKIAEKMIGRQENIEFGIKIAEKVIGEAENSGSGIKIAKKVIERAGVRQGRMECRRWQNGVPPMAGSAMRTEHKKKVAFI